MIGYYVHHQGSGHARRATEVARHLRHPVTGLGSGGPPAGWTGAWIELARDDVDPPVREPELLDVDAGGVLHWVPRHHRGLLRRHRALVDWLEDASPALVVVDCSVEVTLLVRLCGVPVVVGAMPGDRTDRAHASAYDVAEALLAPWPEHSHPDAGWPADWWEKTWHVGGISALAAAGHQPPAPRPPAPSVGLPDRAEPARALLLWGTGGATPDRQALDGARAATPDWDWALPSGGDLWEDLQAADVVVCHAGQGAVADVALARRPAVVVAQPRPHDEQLATTLALRRLGLAATAVSWPAPHRWPELLDQARRIGGAGWKQWGGDGGPRAAGLLDRLADRLADPDPAHPAGAGR